MTFHKGDRIHALNKRTRKAFSFVCPRNGMCKATLTRYCIVELELGEATDKFLFTKE